MCAIGAWSFAEAGPACFQRMQGAETLAFDLETTGLDPRRDRITCAETLAFDLETTGLDPRRDRITCAAVCDPAAGLERVFFFHDPASSEREASEFMRLLDEAPRLCAFNGARFDLPFVQHQLGADAARVRAWRLKLHDVYEACRLALGVTFPLHALLSANGLAGKTGSGRDAIELARERRWDELGRYCLNDTLRTHEVSALASIVLPKTHCLFMRADGTFAGS